MRMDRVTTQRSPRLFYKLLGLGKKLREFGVASYGFDGVAAAGVSISLVCNGGVGPKPGSSL
jgi:hypothetical protein